MGGLFHLFWGKAGISQKLGHCPLFVLLWSAPELSWSLWVCHLEASIKYSELVMRLQVHWKLNLPPFGTQLVLTNFCYILNSCHFFKDFRPCSFPPLHQTESSQQRKGNMGKIMYWLLTALLEMIYVPSAQIALVWTSHMTKSNPMGVERVRETLSLLNQTWVLAGHLAKPVSWYLIVVKGITAFISGHQTRGTGSWCSKESKLPSGSQGKGF